MELSVSKKRLFSCLVILVALILTFHSFSLHFANNSETVDVTMTCIFNKCFFIPMKNSLNELHSFMLFILVILDFEAEKIFL